MVGKSSPGVGQMALPTGGIGVMAHSLSGIESSYVLGLAGYRDPDQVAGLGSSVATCAIVVHSWPWGTHWWQIRAGLVYKGW